MNYFLFIKSLHIISIIAWMAGMLYLPRLYVYHTQAKAGSDTDMLLQTMERRLLRFIINPAMGATFIFGILLAAELSGSGSLGGWFHAKIMLVLALAAFHGALAKWRKDFTKGQNMHSARFYRIINEVPTLLMIAIVFLVVMKPF